jgi:hypothetical protein
MVIYKGSIVNIKQIIAFIFITQISCVSLSSEIQELEVSKIIHIDWDGKLDLSGLTYCDNKILAVADNLNDRILELTISTNSSTFSTKLKLKNLTHPDTDFTLMHAIKNYFVALFYGKMFDWGLSVHRCGQ